MGKYLSFIALVVDLNLFVNPAWDTTWYGVRLWFPVPDSKELLSNAPPPSWTKLRHASHR